MGLHLLTALAANHWHICTQRCKQRKVQLVPARSSGIMKTVHKHKERMQAQTHAIRHQLVLPVVKTRGVDAAQRRTGS